jgi:hypothetical protein
MMEIATAGKRLRRHRLSICTKANNVDLQLTRGFGREWSTFRQDSDHLSQQQRQAIFEAASAWMWAAAPAVGAGRNAGPPSHLLDPSAEALNVAKENLRDMSNASYTSKASPLSRRTKVA